MERKLIAAAVSSALALPMSAQAVEFSVSGQINRAIISVDGGGPTGKPDANNGDVKHVDANSSSTRFRFTGSEELESGMTAGMELELGRPDDWRTRHANVYLSTAGGKITVGQAWEATGGVAFAHLGGLSFLGGVTNWCSYHSSGPACPSNSGTRSPVLRYDTPAIGPSSIAVSTGNNDFFDIKLSIAGSVGDAGYDFRIGHVVEYEKDLAEVAESNDIKTGAQLAKAADKDADKTVSAAEKTAYEKANPGITELAGANPDWSVPAQAAAIYNVNTPGKPKRTEDVGDITTMSGSVSFGQGTSVTAAWSQANTGTQVEYQYVALDHSYGDGSIGVYYKTGEYGADYKSADGKTTSKKGVEGSLWGIGIGHNLGGGAAAYAGYRQISEDGMKDIDLLVAGMRVTFN